MSDHEQDDTEPHYEILYKSDQSVDQYLRRDGEARVKFANGDSFEGNYLNGKRHGPGTYTYANGAVFTGTYEAGVKTGQGKFSYPDGSSYEGEFVNDLRHGQGVYVFVNGDRYEGGWKMGKKHGKGVYVFNQSINQPNQSNDQETRVVGEWSNGKLLQGEWSQAGNDKLIARFMNNQPNGHSIYQSNKGFLYAGNQSLNEEKQPIFEPIDVPSNKKSSTQSNGPAAGPPDALTLAKRSLLIAQLNADWIEGNYRLKKVIEHVPNFRRISHASTQAPADPPAEETEEQANNQTNVFMCGQPSIEGTKLLVGHLNEASFDKVCMVVCRREAMLYVGDVSYTPRHPKKMHTPMRFNQSNNQSSNLSVEQLEALETYLSQLVNTRVQHAGGLLKYQREVYADFESQRRGIDIEIEVDANMKIQTLRDIVTTLVDEDGLNLTLVRNPMDERFVTVDEWSSTIDCVRSVHQSHGDAALVFVDWLGRENATAAAVIALANKQLLTGFPVPESEKTEQENESEEHHDEEPAEKEPEAEPAEKDEEEEEEEEEEAEEEDEDKPKEPEPEPVPEQVVEKPVEPEPVNDGPPPEPVLPEEPVVIDEKRGVFNVTHWLIHCLTDGHKAKEVADSLIDDAGAAVNLRECIFQAHQEWREANQSSPEQATLWLAEARLAIERYCMMIASVAYLAAVRPPVTETEENDEEEAPKPKTPHVTFAQWLNRQVNMVTLKEKCQLFAWD